VRAATVSWSTIESAGHAQGLEVLAATGAAPFDDTRAVLEQRRARGLAGTMQFTYRNPRRSTDPDRTLPGAATLIAGAVSYHREVPDAPQDRGPLARVARYVWADDHERLLRGLGAVADHLEAGGYRACVVADQNHLVDRAVAARAGLGWYGKNANLLLPGRGSWYLLGTVVTDAPLSSSGVGIVGAPPAVEVPDGCGTCERCLPACPTGAIVAPGVVDARRCLSWILQDDGDIAEQWGEAVGDRIYGCDDCQDVCPPNRVELRRAAPGGRGEPAPAGETDRAWVPVLELLAATDAELLARYGRWYLAHRDPRYLRRNALVVLGNIGDGDDPDVRGALARAIDGPDELLASHARWSAMRLGCDDLVVRPPA
jgi:epoxyqueuosine reductase